VRKKAGKLGDCLDLLHQAGFLVSGVVLVNDVLLSSLIDGCRSVIIERQGKLAIAGGYRNFDLTDRSLHHRLGDTILGILGLADLYALFGRLDIRQLVHLLHLILQQAFFEPTQELIISPESSNCNNNFRYFGEKL